MSNNNSNDITIDDIKNWLIITIVITLFLIVGSILYLNNPNLKAMFPNQERLAWNIIKNGFIVLPSAIILLNLKVISIFIWSLIVKGFKKLFSCIFKTTTPKTKTAVKGKSHIKYTGAPLKQGLPPLSLLGEVKVQKENVDQAETMKRKLISAFTQFDLNELKVTGYEIGSTVTNFYIDTGSGKIRLANIRNALDDIALKVGVQSIALSTSRGSVCLEITNAVKQIVTHREVLEELRNEKLKELSIPIGRLARGTPFYINLQKLPHLLIAGTTGGGKSVALNDVIISLILMYTPEELQLVMIDPKRVELAVYSPLPHLKMPICKGADEGLQALYAVVKEMENRYKIMEKMGIKKLHDVPVDKRPFPILITVIDELADLIMTGGNNVETALERLAQLGRASGIHLVLCTQRPDAETLTGRIRSNVPLRIALKVAKAADSRIILDCEGAEKLVGEGDGYALSDGVSGLIRFQSSFIEDARIEAVVSWWSKNYKPVPKAVTIVDGVADVVEQEEDEPIMDTPEQEDTTKPEYILRRKICEDVIGNDDNIEIKLPAIREIAESLNISYRQTARIIDKLCTESWISKIGTTKNAKTVVSLNKEEADIWLAEND